MFSTIIRALVALTALSVSGALQAATIFESTELVATSASRDTLLPEAETFTVATAGNYTVTLRDLNTPALMDSLSAIVTRDLQVVAELELTYQRSVVPEPTPAPATVSFTATPGAYRVHVLGVARAGEPGGTFGISVAPDAGGTSLLNTVDVINADSSPAEGVSVAQHTFTVTQAGTYQVAVLDHVFPTAAVTTQVLLLKQTPTGPEPVIPIGGSFAADAATYDLYVYGTATGADRAGLYSVTISGGPSSAVVHRSTNAVGNLAPATNVSLATAGQYSLVIADANFPAALSSIAGTVIQLGTELGRLTAAGTVNVNAAQGTAQLFTFATPATTGAFGVRLSQGAQSVHADVRIVDISANPATPAIYAFSSPSAVAAGNYRLALQDFRFPAAFASIRAAVAQGDTIVDSRQGEGDLDVALQAGTAKILVAVTPPATSENALFGIGLTAQPAGTLILESTQGVGGLFRMETVQIATAGPYDITLADLQFPQTLRTAALAITRGTTLEAQIFGGGTVAGRQLTPGTYVLNFLGQPAANAQYGAYGLKVADSPPAPTVTLSATPTSVTSGQATSLQWSATNATSCTASGGWTGGKATSGTQQSAALTTNTTFDLSCSGPGGSSSASVSVTVNAPSAGGGGGGGAIDAFLLIYICMGIALTARRRRQG